MDIAWLGHSCFRLRSRDLAVLTDPYSPDTGYNLGQPSADIVTVSHEHTGHSFVQGVGGSPRAVRGAGEYDIRGVVLLGLATFHDDEGGHQRGKNAIYWFEMEDLAIVHLGDLGHRLTPAQKEAVGRVDILMAPVGGVSTIGGAVAAEVVKQLKPRVVLPMHYQTEARKSLEPLAGFLAAMGVTEATPQPRLTISRTSLPPETKVVVLDYPR